MSKSKMYGKHIKLQPCRLTKEEKEAIQEYVINLGYVAELAPEQGAPIINNPTTKKKGFIQKRYVNGRKVLCYVFGNKIENLSLCISFNKMLAPKAKGNKVLLHALTGIIDLEFSDYE